MRWTKRAAVAVGSAALTILASGCWYQPGFDGNRSSYNPFEKAITTANVSDLTQIFQTDEGTGFSEPTPVVGAGGVVVNVDGTMHVYDRVTGIERWSKRVEPAATGTTTTIQASDPYLIDGGKDVVWTAHRGGLLQGVPDIEVGGVRERADLATGATIETEDPVSVLQAVRGTRWAGGNLQASHTGTPLRIEVNDFNDPTYHWGGRVWSTWDQTGAGNALTNESMTLGRDRLYVRYGIFTSITNDYLAAFDLTQPCPVDPTAGEPVCRPIWERPLSINSLNDTVISEDGTTLFETNINDQPTIAYDASTGAERWSTAAAESAEKPALANGHLYVASVRQLRVYAADGCGASSCEPLWTSPTPSITWSTTTAPVVAGDVVYVGTADSNTGAVSIEAFPAAGCGAAVCNAIWTAALPARAQGIAVSFGHVYVTTSAGTVAFGLPR